jgi:hypothetical protein
LWISLYITFTGRVGGREGEPSDIVDEGVVLARSLHVGTILACVDY